MKVSKHDVINDLKILRRLFELLHLTDDEHDAAWAIEEHIEKFLDGDCYGDEEDGEAPFNLAFVMVTICSLYKHKDGRLEDERRALKLLADACTFVAPKEEEKFRYRANQLRLRSMIQCSNSGYYSLITLPSLLRMIDLALKESKPLG